MYSFSVAVFITNTRLTIVFILLSLILICIPTAVSSNSENKNEILDTSYPILISEKYNRPQAELPANLSDLLPNSYFGYSVSLAKGMIKPNHPLGWIFIGAPKSNTSDSIKYNKKISKEPGVIWRCSLGRTEPVNKDSCEMLNVDPGDNRKKVGNPRNEDHSEAFIGGITEINYNRFVSCGMKWNRTEDTSFYNGICYWFADNDNFGKTSYRTNDLTKLVNKDSLDQRLMPFFVPANDIENAKNAVFNFQNLKNRNERGYEWQLSQAGISVHLFLEPGKSDTPNLLIGAPGVRRWAGAVVLYTNKNSSNSRMERLNRNKMDATFSELRVLNRGLIPKKQSENNQEHWYDYFGYSVSSGKYLEKNQVLYAAGAPRANYAGAVVIFDAKESALKSPINPKINIAAPKDSFASYFGSVLHSVDYDDDELDELVVGAPLCSSSQYVGDEGCVFVYKFKNVENKHDVNLVNQLFGSKYPGARFGSAITSLRMESKDSKLMASEVYLVIGAPFEPAEDNSKGVGAIYLYLYNKGTGKFDSVAQRIHASRISNALNGFGSSLSIPQDIDNNETSDLGIGAFKSGHAVVLRTRPRISIKSWIEFQSLDKETITIVRRGTTEFYLKSCFSVKKVLGAVTFDEESFQIWTTIQFFDKRIEFKESSVGERGEYKKNKLTFYSHVDLLNKTCKSISVRSLEKNGFGMESDDERERPEFEFKQTVWYNGTFNRTLSVLNIYAENPSSKVENESFNVSSFDRFLPSPQKFTSSPDIKVPISSSDCRNIDACKPKLNMSWSFYHPESMSQSIKSFKISKSQDIIMKLVIGNNGESGIKPIISFQWNHLWVTESMTGGRWLHFHECKEEQDKNVTKIYHQCILHPKRIQKGKDIIVQIRLNMGDFYASGPQDFNFVVKATITFSNPSTKIVESSGELRIIVPPTMATIRGSKLAHDNILGGPISYYVAKLTNGTKDDGKAVHNYHYESNILYTSIRPRFKVLVEEASVNEAILNFKIPVSWDGKQMFVVRRPHVKAENIHCHPTSPRNGFHKIEKISPGSSHPRGHNRSKEHDDPMPNPGIIIPVDPKRRRRDTAAGTTNQTANAESQIAVDSKMPNPPPRQAKITPPSDALEFRCVSETDCLIVACSMKNVKAEEIYTIQFEMFPIKENVDGLLKSSGKSALYIEVTGSVDIFPLATAKLAYYHDVDTAEVILKKQTVGKVEAWVYIAAFAGGIFLLILIILTLFKCGFFKREKLEELNHLKAEHHRKSMIAAARASMMVLQSTTVATSPEGGACESRENLTEAEVHNEDTEVKPPVKSKQVEFAPPSYKELEAKDDL